MFDLIARPFGILLMFLYDLVNNYALSLLLIAVVIKVILLPFQMKGKRGQLRQARLQPKIAELQKKHGANKQKLNEEMAKLYKEEGINPASGCLWSFIQMPIMIALFYAIRQPLTLMMGVAKDLISEGGAIYLKLQEMGFVSTMTEFYLEIDQAQFMSRPENWGAFSQWASDGLQQIFFNLGPINLAVTPDWQVWNFPWNDGAALLPLLLLFMFPVLSSGAQFVSMAIMRKMNVSGTPEAAGGTMGTVLKFMPLMSLWFGFILPAALSFYWTIGTILQIGQDIWLTKKYTKIIDEEEAVKDVARKAKEAEIEAKREETERKKAEGLIEQNTNTSKRKKKKSNKQGQIEKAAEWEKKNTPVVVANEKYEPSREGNRRYARGRAFDPDRFSRDTDEDADESTEDIEKVDDLAYDNAEEELELDYEDESDEDFEDEDDEDDSSEDFEDEDDEDDLDEDFEDGDEDDFDDDSDDDFDDDDDTTAPASEKFETKRFD